MEQPSFNGETTPAYDELDAMQEKRLWEGAKYSKASDVVVWFEDDKEVIGMIMDTALPIEVKTNLPENIKSNLPEVKSERSYSIKVRGKEGIFNIKESVLDRYNESV